MKKWLLWMVFTGWSVWGTAQGIEFFHGTYEEILQKAQAEQKQVFVDVYTSWCGPCKQMSQDVFPRPEVGIYYNTHYVCLKLDAEKDKDHGFFRNFRADAFPSFFWLDAQGKLLDMQIGYARPEQFIQWAADAVHADLGEQLEEGKKRWECGERTPTLVKEYVLGILGKIRPEQVKPMVMAYLEELTDEQLCTEENYRILSQFMREAGDHPVFRILMRNAGIYQYYEPGYEFWIRMYRMVVRSGILLRDDPEKYQAYVDFLHHLESPLAEMYTEILGMEHTLFRKDFSQGIPEAMILAEKYSQYHPYLPGQFFYTLIIAGFFQEEQVDTVLANQVIGLAEKALRNRPSKENLLYLSVAYARRGDYRKAYEFMASEPFFPEPVLSNAIYKYLNLPVIRKENTKAMYEGFR